MAITRRGSGGNVVKSGGFTIETNATWKMWLDLETRIDIADGLEEFAVPVREMYDASQSVVHVITGQLKGSGEYDVRRDGDRIVGEVRYLAPYAIFEMARGGDHDFMDRGWRAARDSFRPAVEKAMAEIVRRAFG